MKKACEHCSASYETPSTKSRFCSSKCRVYYSRGAKPKEVVTDPTIVTKKSNVTPEPIVTKRTKRKSVTMKTATINTEPEIVTMTPDPVVTIPSVTILVEQERFFLDQCPDDLWCLIPEGLRQEWCNWCSSTEERPQWVTIVTGGYPSFVTFCLPVEVDLAGPKAVREPTRPKQPLKTAAVLQDRVFTSEPISIQELQRKPTKLPKSIRHNPDTSINPFARLSGPKFDSSKTQFKKQG